MEKIIAQLTKEFKLKAFQVENTVKLIDEGNTVPFIARYRKEMTGELNDQVLRELYERMVYLRGLEARREEVKRLINDQEKLTDEVAAALDKAESLQEIDDIYRPYRPKRRTRATVAKEKGLEPLATILLTQKASIDEIEIIAEKFISSEKQVASVKDALDGAMDIIAGDISDNASYRKKIRDIFLKQGMIVTKARKEEDSVYRMYYDFSEPVASIASHRVLAINRGEKEKYLQVRIDVPKELIIGFLKKDMINNPPTAASLYVEKALEDAFERLIHPSVENEVRNELTKAAEEQAIKVFSNNLGNLLLQPPIRGKVVMGLDPAYRTGCKIAVVDETGRVLDTAVVYPTPPQNRVEESMSIIKNLIDKYRVDIISIGNGTASREAEIFIAGLLKQLNRAVYYMVVSEAGASVYSASKLGAEEFPEYDVSLRSAVSIARRLQDPLAELVKIDPKSIGVGQYQHDINQKRLDESLRNVVEDCVNSVGVDLNTASAVLLSYISGITTTTARNIIKQRETNGRFASREELKKVKSLGEKTFQQCAGFLRIPEGGNILDNTSVHPESYNSVQKLLDIMKYSQEDILNRNINGLRQKVETEGVENTASLVGIGVPTLRDILNELSKPGRDPRDELPKPILLTDILSIEDLRPGMVLKGTVRNVADFGAFVDIGVHQDGLVHISELSDRFVRNPMEVVAVGDIITVRILEVDTARKRISLSMKEA